MKKKIYKYATGYPNVELLTEHGGEDLKGTFRLCSLDGIFYIPYNGGIIEWVGNYPNDQYLRKYIIKNGEKLKIEKKYIPRDGDFVYCGNLFGKEQFAIFEKYCDGSDGAEDYEGFPIIYASYRMGDETFNEKNHTCVRWDIERKATKKEKSHILSVMHKCGKDWDDINHKIILYNRVIGI